ncbi:hypothetical protein RND81_02G047700 [Saponaria officinalis]|uniref:Uncharacterized protein n=1 Tax=Saponaria officinalis TaxID=3572 RepID=A0AAW1MJX4_SAPOF
MGCGGSKLDPTQDDIPTRFKPNLQRRLEEIRAERCITGSNDGLSKKELLGETNNEDHEEVAFQFTQDCPPLLQKINDDDTSLKLSQEVAGDNVDGNGNETDEGRFLRKRHRLSKGSSFGGVNEETIDLDDFERGVYIGRASPSFKVYCTEFVDDEFDELEHVSEDIALEEETNSISQESTCSNEVSVKQIATKKGKRGMRFKITMPKGGRLYKNMQLFSIFQCSSQTNSHLLQKAAV